jgi:hypothetical protein
VAHHAYTTCHTLSSVNPKDVCSVSGRQYLSTLSRALEPWRRKRAECMAHCNRRERSPGRSKLRTFVHLTLLHVPCDLVLCIYSGCGVLTVSTTVCDALGQTHVWPRPLTAAARAGPNDGVPRSALGPATPQRQPWHVLPTGPLGGISSWMLPPRPWFWRGEHCSEVTM